MSNIKRTEKGAFISRAALDGQTLSTQRNISFMCLNLMSVELDCCVVTWWRFLVLDTLYLTLRKQTIQVFNELTD